MAAKPITKTLAEQSLRAIEKQFADYLFPGAGPVDRPTLFPPGHDGPHWVICWEGNAPYQWTLAAFCGGTDEEIADEMDALGFPDGGRIDSVPVPAGVHPEAINGYTLGLYPA